MVRSSAHRQAYYFVAQISTGTHKVYGFNAAAVFGVAQTEGPLLPDPNPELTKWIARLAVIDIARAWEITVETYNGNGAKAAGMYRSNGSIVLGVKILATWCHEMVHAADHRNVGQFKGGQQFDQRIRLIRHSSKSSQSGRWPFRTTGRLAAEPLSGSMVH